MFDTLYANIGVFASKNSGKTNNLYRMLEKTINKTSRIWCFSSSVYNCLVWAQIKELLKRKGCEVSYHADFIEDNGVNMLNALVASFIDIAKEEEEAGDVEDEPDKYEYIDDRLIKVKTDKQKERAPRKPKYKAPENVIIVDDMSQSLKSPYVQALLKRNRHYKIRTIILTQDLKDASPSALMNLDYILLYPNISEERLLHIYHALGLSIPIAQFMNYYTISTAEPYCFLYINRKNEKDYRKNFNMRFDN